MSNLNSNRNLNQIQRDLPPSQLLPEPAIIAQTLRTVTEQAERIENFSQVDTDERFNEILTTIRDMKTETSNRINHLEARMTQNINDLEARMNRRLDNRVIALEVRLTDTINDRCTQIERRIDDLDTRTNLRFQVT